MSLGCDTLYVYGEVDHIVVDGYENFHSLNGRISSYIIPKMGHFVFFKESCSFINLINGFLTYEN